MNAPLLDARMPDGALVHAIGADLKRLRADWAAIAARFGADHSVPVRLVRLAVAEDLGTGALDG